jgi:hypothetical protein
MYQSNLELTAEIMKLVRNMADDSMIEGAIIKALQLKYSHGREEGSRSEREYPHKEDMGR